MEANLRELTETGKRLAEVGKKTNVQAYAKKLVHGIECNWQEWEEFTVPQFASIVTGQRGWQEGTYGHRSIVYQVQSVAEGECLEIVGKDGRKFKVECTQKFLIGLASS